MSNSAKASPGPFFILSLYMVVVVGTISVPSLKLGYFQHVSAPYELPQSLRPGEALILPLLPGLEEVKFGDLKFTIVPEANSLLAFASIYDGSHVRIWGLYKPQVKMGVWKFLLPGQHKLFETSLPISHFKMKRAPALNISDKTWDKVQKAAKSKGQQERALMAEILSRSGPDLFGQSCFKLPLDSKVISGYGSPRSLPNGRRYHHSGIDLRSRRPEELYPMGEGQVVFADHMSVPGNMVVIDHGGYLHSRYMHLSELKVEPGEMVDSSSLIGKTGSTGRITGPHLHWEVLWHGRAINPMALIEVWSQIKDCKIESDTALPSYLVKNKELEELLFSENEEL